MNAKLVYGGILIAIIIAIGAYFYPSVSGVKFGAVTTIGTNGIPTVLSGGSQPTYLNALEASESVISDGPAYFLGKMFSGSTGATVTSNIVTTQTIKQALVSGTSTPCSIQNPLNATSTIVAFSFNIPQSGATTSAIAWSVGTSTTQFATSSSMLKNVSIAASNAATVAWNPGANNGVITPTQWILIGPDNVTANTTGAFNSIVIGGTCQITVQTVS